MLSGNLSVKMALSKFLLDSYPLLLDLMCYKANTDYTLLESHKSTLKGHEGHGKSFRMFFTNPCFRPDIRMTGIFVFFL